MMDEQLIAEVEHHGVIYNRQKYSINNMGVPGGSNGTTTGGSGGNCGGVNKYETKDEAWQIIAIKLRSDVETCKKRWKYLRERYVSQRKQGDPPVYEHLSRPYLEKMKFLDQHIQPRKSYRNVSNFLTSPNASSSFCEYNMDSSKSNSSAKNLSSYTAATHQQQQSQSTGGYQQDGVIKTEADQTFRDFAAAVQSQSQHLQQMSSHHPAFNSTASNGMTIHSKPVDSYDQYRESDHHTHSLGAIAAAVSNGVTASSPSSSMKSPFSASPPPPPPIANSEMSDDHQLFAPNSSNNMKKPRVQMSTGQYVDTSDSDDNTSPASTMNHSSMLSENHSTPLRQSHHSHQQQHHHHHQQQQQQQQQHQQQQQYNKMLSNVARNMNNMNHSPSTAGGLFPSNSDFLFSLYQHMTPAAAAAAIQQERNSNTASTSGTRSSEHLLGELVTSELLKMNKDRRKTVQKRILEILFFED